MPKVERIDHRRRLRGASLPRARFPTLKAEDHTYEFDRSDMSLRISGTGSQDLLSQGDTRALYGFLRRVYEPAAQPTTPLRLERRVRRHSQRPVKPEAHQANPRPDKDATEVHQEPLEFGEYN